MRVITYGTYDLLHRGHIRLLERAKALGDYLIVGVTADDFDKTRGKINVEQSLMERIENVRSTGLADEIIVEEYEGQKIDDIRRYGIDVFTVGSDWEGKFDYLREYCEVVYLPRTEGVSSSELRASSKSLRLGLVGESVVLEKFANECAFVNGVELVGICSSNKKLVDERFSGLSVRTASLAELLERVDAVYIMSHPSLHYEQIKAALLAGKHALCESPVVLMASQYEELKSLASSRNLVLAEAIKTAFSVAYNRMLLLAKSGAIGSIVSIDAVCTSQRILEYTDSCSDDLQWNSLQAWGPTALLPVFQLLGTEYVDSHRVTVKGETDARHRDFTKIDFEYPKSVASIRVAKGVKSEGELVISGTGGYIYVPAPWWKTDYFEVRFEDARLNKRYFYQLDGEGIRYEIVDFVRSIKGSRTKGCIPSDITQAIVREMTHASNQD